MKFVNINGGHGRAPAAPIRNCCHTSGKLTGLVPIFIHMWTTTTTTAASVALVTAVSMVPAPQEAAVSITGAEITRDRAALEAGLACLA